MQDEPVGLKNAHLPWSSEEEKDASGNDEDDGREGAAEGEEAGKRASQAGDSRADYSLSGFSRARFCPTQPLRDLQLGPKSHQQSSSQQLAGRRRPHPTASPPPTPPPLPSPLGRYGHLPGPERRRSPVEEAQTDAATSPSPAPVNLHLAHMDSPIAHHINGNGGSGGGNMLSGGLGAAFPGLPAQELQSAGVGSSSPSLPGFGTPWSVQTSSSPPPAAPPPPAPNSINPMHANAINHITGTDSENGFYAGIPSSINPAFFQSFSPVSANPCAGINVQGFSGPFSPQINVPPQAQSRRSPVSPQMHPQQGAFLQQRNNYNQHQVSCCCCCRP